MSRSRLSLRQQEINMSTWHQHALSNTTVNHQNSSVNNHTTNNGSNVLNTNELLGEVNHTSSLSGDFGNLFNQLEYSDIELVVDSEHFYAHRIILAARSQYFCALLYGGLRESQQDNRIIEIKECKPAAFKMLLYYIYTGQINLLKENEDVLLDLLGLVHQYGFQALEKSLSNYLKSILSVKNVCTIYDTACLYNLSSLKQHAAQFIDNHTSDIIQTNEFSNLAPDAFSSIISRDSFYCPEIEIFQAVKRWHESHFHDQEENFQPYQNIVSKVRLTLMSINELLKIVRYSNLFDPNHIMDAIDSINDEIKVPVHTIQSKPIKYQTSSREKNYRGRLRLDENIATSAYHAQVTEGEIKHALLDGDTTNYDLDRGFTRHPIDDTHCISVRFDEPSIINHIKLLLWDRDTRAYSYYIEVSVDELTWTRIIDYRRYLCRSWQKLYFPPVVARSIRIFGTHNTVNKVFHLVSMQVYYIEKSHALIGDINAPIDNVAKIEESAVVSEGVSRVRNALINGDYLSYDWDSGYTCHQLGSGGIVIQLSQPHIVSSMRLLLWDCDSRSYSYYIETSYDSTTWSRVVDKQKVACKSWQILTFSPRIVVFIRICGTHNTANEVFHCVHFECPCRPDVLQSYMNEQTSISTTDQHEENSITYDEYYTSIKSLFHATNDDSSMITDSGCPVHSYINLPFRIQTNSSAIYPIENETDETNINPNSSAE